MKVKLIDVDSQNFPNLALDSANNTRTYENDSMNRSPANKSQALK